MKSLGLDVKERNKTNVSLNKDGTIQFETNENRNIFKSFYSELATNLVKKISNAPNKSDGGTIKAVAVYLTIKETNFSYSTYPKM